VLRDAPRKPTAERDGAGNRLVNGSAGVDLVLPLVCVEVEEKWISGASSCHEAMHAQHGLPIAFIGIRIGYKIKLIEARASVAHSKY
jgi:hypothetical protein